MENQFSQPNPKTISFNLDKITKSEKKHLKKYCEMVYREDYKSVMDWLPESIYDVTSDDISHMASVEAITGMKVVESFLKLRKSALEIKKRLP